MLLSYLHLVQVLVQCGQPLLQSLAFADLLHDHVGLGCGLGRVAGQDLPVVEHGLRECLASGVAAQVRGEACNQNQSALVPITFAIKSAVKIEYYWEFV